LEGCAAVQSLSSFAELWGISVGEARDRVKKLIDIGILKRRVAGGDEYVVPLLYHPSLKVQTAGSS
jgi:DNA-binding Lrp family transcriptional regulator